MKVYIFFTASLKYLCQIFFMYCSPKLYFSVLLVLLFLIEMMKLNLDIDLDFMTLLCSRLRPWNS